MQPEPPRKLPTIADLADFVTPVEEVEAASFEPLPGPSEPLDTQRPTPEQMQQANRANLSLANAWNPWAQASKKL